RSLSRATRDGNRPLMILDNAVSDGQSQARAFTDFFRREKGVKNAFFQAGRNSRAAVLKIQFDRLGIRSSGNGNPLLPRIGQGVAGVGEHVDKYLFQLNGVAD